MDTAIHPTKGTTFPLPTTDIAGAGFRTEQRRRDIVIQDAVLLVLQDADALLDQR